MALNPGAEVRGGMLVAIFIGGAERMVQFQRRQERRKRHQAQAEDGNKEDY